MPSSYDKYFPDNQSVTDQAFHGTSRAAAEQILASGFKPGNGDELFLGPGVYFFERGSSEAKKWAKGSKHASGWSVLKSVICTKRCLFVQEKEHNDILIKLARGMRSKLDRDVTVGEVTKLLAQDVRIDTVVSIDRKHSAKAIWHGARFEIGSRLIICVRNVANILHTQEHCTGS